MRICYLITFFSFSLSFHTYAHFYNWDRHYDDEPAFYIHTLKKKIGSAEYIKFLKCPCQMIHNEIEPVTTKPYDRNFCWSLDKNKSSAPDYNRCENIIGDRYLSRSSLQTLIVGAKGDQYLVKAMDGVFFIGALKLYKKAYYWAAKRSAPFIYRILAGIGIFTAENKISNYLLRSHEESKVKKELLNVFDYYVSRGGIDDPFFDNTVLDYWKYYTTENEKNKWQKTKDLFKPIADSWRTRGKNMIILTGIDRDQRFGNKLVDHKSIDEIEESVKLLFNKLVWKPGKGPYGKIYNLELSDTKAKRRGLPANYNRFGE